MNAVDEQASYSLECLLEMSTEDLADQEPSFTVTSSREYAIWCIGPHPMSNSRDLGTISLSCREQNNRSGTLGAVQGSA